MPIDTDGRMRQEMDSAQAVLEQVHQRDEAEAGNDVEREAFLDIDARKARREQLRQRAARLAGEVPVTAEGVPGVHQAAKSRSRLIGQLFGQVTWQLTRAEIAVQTANRETAAKQRRGGKAGRRGKKVGRRTSGKGKGKGKKRGHKRRDTTELTLNQLAKMEEEDSEPEDKPVRIAKKDNGGIEDPDDWGPGSSNQNVRCVHDVLCGCVAMAVAVAVWL